jgi:ABC-type sugar transport system substrate-binding protein
MIASNRSYSSTSMVRRDRRRTPLARRLAVVLGLVLTIAACGDDSSDGEDSADTSGTAVAGATAATGGDLTGKAVDFVGYGNDNPWAAHFNKVFIPMLEAEGVKVVDHTTMDAGAAVTNFNQAISNKPDLIVAALLDTSSMVVPIQKAKEDGIPVLVFDGRPDPSVDGDVMQVLSDNAALGLAAAQNLVEGLKAQGKESGNIIVITGTKSGYASQDRMEAFNAEMAKFPEYKIVEDQDGNWDPALTGQIATQLFAKYGCDGVQGAYGMADYMALAIVASAKQAGCEVGAASGLIVTGSNCFKAGIESIRAGEMYGTATEDPGTIAVQTAEYVLRFLNGENPPPKEIVKEERVTAANVEELAAQCSDA